MLNILRLNNMANIIALKFWNAFHLLKLLYFD